MPGAALLAGLVLLSFGCRGDGAADPGASGTPSKGGDGAQAKIVLEVAGAAYSAADFEKYLTLNLGPEWRTLAPPALSRVFDNYIKERLFLRDAKSRAITLTEDEKTRYLNQFKKATRIEDSDIRIALPDADTLNDKLLVEKYLSMLIQPLAVDAAAVAAYYDGHKAEFLDPEQFQVSQILLPSEGAATSLRDRIQGAGEEEFRLTARNESTGVEKVKGGLMGVFSAGQLPPELEKVILSLKPGEISRVVQSSYGFHIFRLDRRFEPHLLTLVEASPGIRAKLLASQSEAAELAKFEELKAGLPWKIFPENLPFAYQRINP
jgi:parvulin-like peptidyl-prolyl isomerase